MPGTGSHFVCLHQHYSLFSLRKGARSKVWDGAIHRHFQFDHPYYACESCSFVRARDRLRFPPTSEESEEYALLGKS
jgi:hypothetical protein